ncbi:MAG: SCO family protein [Anaerolineales bacterium]|nr:SCO family protein [Anaerolineales bacterium]
MSKKNLFLLTIGIFFGSALAGYTLQRFFPYTFHGLVLQEPKAAPEFLLTDHNGQLAKLSRFQGKIVILFFGYTNCPDVCPTTLSTLAKALSRLGKKASDVQVLFVSVDPTRDTQEQLAAYVTQFDPDFLGLTGNPGAIAQTAADYGIYYEVQPGESEDVYWIDHTSTIMVIDPRGRLRLVLPFGVSAEDVAADLQRLLK